MCVLCGLSCTELAKKGTGFLCTVVLAKAGSWIPETGYVEKDSGFRLNFGKVQSAG